MDSVLRQYQYDENGNPRRPHAVTAEMMAAFNSGDFSDVLQMPPLTRTAKEVRRESRERSTNILSGWNTLRQILERHEEVLRKRWLKKTKSQRSSVVLRVCPKMFAAHRPDHTAWMNGGPDPTKSRDAYIMPHMNVEDLVKGKNLLLFLHSRGRNPPHMFAHADSAAGKLGRRAVSHAYVHRHSIAMKGESVESYGRLVSWDDEIDVMIDYVSGLAHDPGRGLIVLEIQEKIFQFLVECCYVILHDLGRDSLISEAVIKPEPPLLRDASEYPTLAMMTAEAPYCLPAQVDFRHLKALIAAKRTSADDHIQSLREDPGYFADSVADWSEHRQEKLLDTSSARDPFLKTPRFLQCVIGSMLTHAHGALNVWDILYEQIDGLVAFQLRYSDTITAKKPLPADYIKALLTFRYDLSQASKGFVSLLQIGFPASPPMRSFFARSFHVPGHAMIGLLDKGCFDQSTTRLIWLFGTLYTDSQQEQVGFPDLMDEIEYLIRSDPKVKAMLSPWVAREVSDLGVIARALHDLEIYQPWAAGFDYAWCDYGDEIEAEFPTRFCAFAEAERTLKEASLVKAFAKYGAPNGGRFFYPSDKRRTKETTESMRQAESNLDFFWEAVDAHCRRKTGQTLDRTSGIRRLERTPNWVEPIKQQNTAPKQVHEDILLLQLNSPDRPTKYVTPEQKTKSKTRGSTCHVSDGTQGITPQVVDRQPTFKLKTRAYKVFTTLFFRPSQSDLPGDIPWTDFLFAMVSYRQDLSQRSCMGLFGSLHPPHWG